MITKAAKETFERHGWSGATIATIAERAGVSQSSVEATYRKKATLLKAAVDYAIRGDMDPMPVRGREVTREIEAAPTAVSMLELHAAHIRGVHSRSAHLAFVVEQAAKADQGVAALWRQMNSNRRDGVKWAARTLLGKPGVAQLENADVETTFWVALDWANYRLLTNYAGLNAEAYERWILTYYLRMFGLNAPGAGLGDQDQLPRERLDSQQRVD